MPIGSGIVYNTGDLILSQVSSSGTAFLETKIAAATSSLIYFDSTARINSASLNSITVGTASYVSGSTSIITNLTASNISASGTGSFGIVGIGTTSPAAKLAVGSSPTYAAGVALIVGTPGNPSTSGTSQPYANLRLGTNTGNSQVLDFGIYDASPYGSWIQATGGGNLAFPSPLVLNPTGGSLGIGTSNPVATLDIENSVANIPILNLGGGIGGENVSDLYVLNSYNVNTGVGFAAKVIGVNISGSLTAQNIPVQRTVWSGVTSATAIVLGTDGPRQGTQDNAFQIWTTSEGTSGSLLTQKFSLTSTGDVGIGTTAPAFLLDVSGSSRHGYRTADNHYFTGSVNISGSLNATASWANNALTASSLVAANSYTITNLTASNISASLTGSFGIVGIGTVNPAYKLDVVSPDVAVSGQPGIISRFSSGVDGRSLIRVINTSNNNTAQAVHAGISFVAYATSSNQPSTNTHEAQIMLSNGTTGGTNDLKFIAPQGMTFWVSSSNVIMTGSGYVNYGTQAIAITPGGFVGIGTASPVSKLHISGSGSTTITITDDALYTNSITNDNSVMTYTVDTGNAAASSAAHVFKRYTTELVRITHEGRVGVGTSIPATGFLDVRSNQSKSLAGPTNIAFFGSNDAANPLGLAVNHESSSGVKMVGLVGTEYGSSGNNIKINETIHVQYTGNVGIGTNSPPQKLSIAAGGNLSFQNTLGATGNYGAIYSYNDLVNTTTPATAIRFIRDVSNIGPDGAIAFDTNNTERIRVTSANGNVGIGTTNPAYLLDVSGSSRHGYRAVDTHQFTGSVSVSGSLNATASWAQNVVSASYALTSSFATRAQTANALNASNTYTVAGLTSAYVDVDGSSAPTTGIYRPSTKTLGLSADGTLIFKISNVSSPATSSIETGNFVVQSGNFGLGTNSPNNKLDIFGGTGTTLNMSNVDDGNRGGKLTFISSSATGRQFYVGTNSSIYNLVFGIDSIEKMRLDTSGNLGIGTTAPAATLHVSGSSGATATFQGSTQSTMNLKVGSFDNYLVGTSTGDISIRPSGSTAVTILSGGNVGIGSTSPAQKLDVAGSAYAYNYFTLLTAATYGPSDNSAAMQVFGSTGSGGLTNTIKFVTGGSERWRITDAGILQSPAAQTIQTSTGNLTLATGGGNGHILLSPNGSGNVGIGTTSPDAILTIKSSSPGPYGIGTPDFAIAGNAGGNLTSLQIYRGANTGSYIGIDAFRSGISGTHLVLNAANNGNVGIGTSNPTGSLHVYQAVGVGETAIATIQEGAGGAAELVFRSGNASTNRRGALRFFSNEVSTTTAQWVVGASLDQSLGDNSFYFYNASSTSILTLSQTNVGIGVNPVAKLQVAGNVSGSSFTSSISNAVGFLGTSSWAQNVVSASFATTAQTANALNASNTYSIAGLTSAYVDVNGSATTPSTGIYRPSSKTLGLSADSTLILKINGSVSPYVTSIESGNVGIGSSNPTSKFEVLTSAVGLANQPNIIGNFRGDTDGRSLIRVDNTSTSAGAAALQAGISFVAYSNVSSQPSANKHEAQIILGSTGATSVTGGQTGTLQIVAPQDIAFNVSASNTIMTGSNYTTFGYNAMYIARSGNVGIGTTVPSARLHVTGSTGGIFEVDTAGGATTFYVSASGNVGIGTANATDKLTLYGALASYKNGADTIQTQVYLANAGNTRAFNLQLNSGGTGLDLWSYNSSNAWLKHTTFNYDGNVGIGTAAPAAKLEITGSSNSALLNIKSPISGAILYVSGSGAVGIGTSNVGAFTLQVSGSFGATTKSFIIDHPTKAGKKLMYGSLESPYHGIRLTGRDTLVNGKCKVELPDYIYKLILHDSVNIQLTGIKCNKTLYVDDINIPENYFTIAYDKAIFESYKDYDFFWDFTAIRADVPELTTEL